MRLSEQARRILAANAPLAKKTQPAPVPVMPISDLIEAISRWNTQASREQSQNHCYWCGGEYEEEGWSRRTVEHLQPKYLGGTDAKTNLAWAHYRCNQERATSLDWVPYHIHGFVGMVFRREE